MPEPSLPPNEKPEAASELIPVPAAAAAAVPPTPPTPPPAKEVTPPAKEAFAWKETAPMPQERASFRDREEISIPKEPIAPPAPAVEKKATEPAPAKPASVPAWARAFRPATPPIPVVPEPPAVETSKPFPEAAPEPVAITPVTPKEPELPVEKPADVFAKAPAEEPAAPPVKEFAVAAEEPVGQGQPIPQLTTALSAEPIISELAQPEPESELVLIEPESTLAAPIVGRQAAQSSIETPSFASKIITTEPIRLQPTTSDIMPETSITPAPETRPSSPTVSVQQPVGGMHTAVQLTFALEIASMQLTPTFKMSGLQLKPMSKVVSMRLAPSQDPQPPMNLQVTFEVAKIDLADGSIGTIRLTPSAQQKPALITSPSFAISGLELMAGSGAAPVQVTPSHQEQASVQLTAEFQIAAIEFTPLFEISTIVLTSTSKKVSMQLPGAGPSSIDSAPVFQIENVQVGGGGSELGLIQVTPGRA